MLLKTGRDINDACGEAQKMIFFVKVRLLFFLLFFLIPPAVRSLEFSVQYLPGDKFKITEKADLRRYENGRFIGLSYREVRGILDVQPGQDGRYEVQGSFFVFEETKHKDRHVARKIDDVVPVKFSL
ncbi:MAG: hypothetical protein FVQ80_19025, partial [Planctomycetes bacterium]|nr:hypothetical protein [Planctomycetota bacterium]